MEIKTNEQYNKIKDGTILKLIQTGDDWDDGCGESFNVIKIGDKLYQLSFNQGYWSFSERDDEGYEILVVNRRKKI